MAKFVILLIGGSLVFVDPGTVPEAIKGACATMCFCTFAICWALENKKK